MRSEFGMPLDNPDHWFQSRLAGLLPPRTQRYKVMRANNEIQYLILNQAEAYLLSKLILNDTKFDLSKGARISPKPKSVFYFNGPPKDQEWAILRLREVGFLEEFRGRKI